MSSPANAIVYYPSPAGNIAKYNLAKSAAKDACPPRLIVVLDISGSMGQTVQRIVQQELPRFALATGYQPDDEVTIIAFESTTKSYKFRVRDLPTAPLRAMGGTYMSPAVMQLQDTLLQGATDQVQAVRLLTLTDGEVVDQPYTLSLANMMRAKLEGKYIFNSQAVRTITSSYGQPDTQALTGMMQLSQTPSELSDVRMLNYVPGQLANVLVERYISDGLQEGSAMLEASEAVIMTSPWKPATNKLRLSPGENVFWIKHDASATFTISGEPVEVHQDSSALDEKLVQELLRNKIEQSKIQISVLKVNGTAEAQAEIRKILDYWTQLDQNMVREGFDMNKILASDTSLATRLATFREYRVRAERSFVAHMSSIANDDRVRALNAAQSADYLRSVSSGSNAKAMARRIGENGTVDEQHRAVLGEFLAIRANIKELEDIKDDDHFRSFYSLVTTLESLRMIAELSEDEIRSMGQDDCLKSICIVGLAAHGNVGDYPDPMTYQLNSLYSGTHVALADVLTAEGLKGELEVPGQPGKVITNVIPVFHDDRIQQFLRKYAPKTLQVVAGVGMRRTWGEISMTYGYTLAAGIVQLVHIIAKPEGRTEGNIRAFISMVRDFRVAVGKYFDHILPQLSTNPPQGVSYWLGRNGLTNMIVPLYDIVTKPDHGLSKQVPAMLRALYTFEIWQPTRRLYRKSEDPQAKADELLNKLMPWDIEQIKAPITPLFEANPAPEFRSDYTLDDAVLEEHRNRCWFVDYVCMFPTLLAAANMSLPDATRHIAALPSVTDWAFLAHTMDIKYPMQKFRFYNLVQALTLQKSEDRFTKVDSKYVRTAPALLDLHEEATGEEMCRAVVRKYVEKRYSQDITVKAKAEVNQLTQEFVNQLLAASASDAAALIRTGIKRGECTVKMTTHSSLAYQVLRPALVDPARHVPQRNSIIGMLLLGKKDGEPVWNAGNSLPQTADQLTELRHAWMISGRASTWDEMITQYKANRRHLYRDLLNRHGHNNEKPSYYGFGYQTLEEMVDSISLEAWDDYKREHVTCCGMPVMGGVMDARIRARLA
jgi:hypothetical protein